MRKYSKTASLAVVLVMLLAASALANGAAPPVGAGPAQVPAPVVETAPAPVVGTPPAPVTATPTERCYTMEQLLPLTVAEAWALSGQDYDSFKLIVQAQTDFAADRRGLTIPDTREAGTEIGTMVRQRAEADPNQLLYVAVDSSVREYATRHGITS